MCGFLVYYSKIKPINKSKFQAALDLMSFRGPDDSGIKYYNSTDDIFVSSFDVNSDAVLAIGHNRLALVDICGSAQPYKSADRENILCFNGELYDAVYGLGYSSDTKFLYEYLVNGGEPHKLQGMYSLALIDIQAKSISVSRDHYGKKPLYFYNDGERLIISSDLRCFEALGVIAEYDLGSIGEYLIFKSSLFFKGGKTLWKGISSLPPGANLIFDLQNLTSHVDHNKRSTTRKLPDVNNFLTDFEKAVAKRFSSETKTAVTVSGGIDSSLNAIIGKKLGHEFDLYTVKLHGEGGGEDLMYSRLLSKDLNCKLYEVGYDDVSINHRTGDYFLDLCIECILGSYSPLNLTNSTIPTFLYTRVMQQNGVKCYLDGVGADEVFGGYPAYNYLFKNNWKAGLAKDAFFHLNNSWLYGDLSTMQRILRMVKLFKFTFNPSNVGRKQLFLEACTSVEVKAGIEDALKILAGRNNGLSHEDFQMMDINEYQLPMYLQIADNMSMMNSIENRSPFLDEIFKSYVFLPNRLKHRSGLNKIILRKAIESLGYGYIANRRNKSGNSSPFSFRKFESDKIVQLLEASKIVRDLFPQHPSKMPIEYRARLLPLAILDVYAIR